MTTTTAQDFLFQRIKALLPPNQTIVDAISELLNISSDSAYRRIRGETQLVFDGSVTKPQNQLRFIPKYQG